jgi:hypothetical protein
MTRKDIEDALDRMLTWPRGRQKDAVRFLPKWKSTTGTSISLSREQVEEIEQRIANHNPRYVSLEEAQERFPIRLVV